MRNLQHHTLIFPDNRLGLADIEIANAQKTLEGSGAGTVGYIAAEQAMGKPSFRSEVFGPGIVLFRMLAGVLPEWPYKWPEQTRRCELHAVST